MLKIENLSIKLDTKKNSFYILRDVTFNIPAKSTVGILGESGSGKSLLAKTISGLLPDQIKKISGKINFNNKELITKADFKGISGKNISMIFQHPTSALNPVLTIKEQLMETVLLHNKELTKRQAEEKSIALLEKTHISSPTERMNSYPHQLSGGMNQRVMIALALATSPSLLIADEPTTALDIITQNQIIHIIQELGDIQQFSTLFITHDISLIQKISDTVVVLYAGEVMEILSAKDLKDNKIKHPCTIALKNCVPSLFGEKKRLYTIGGQMAKNDDRYNNSCIFYERCPRVIDKCKSSKPLFKDNIKCFNPAN